MDLRLADTVTLATRYSQKTLEVSFFSLGLRVYDKLKNCLENCQKFIFVTVFTITRVQKMNFRHLWDLRLADTETQATRSHRRIESSALVLWCIKKTKPGHCGKSHFLTDLYPDLGKKTNFGHF